MLRAVADPGVLCALQGLSAVCSPLGERTALPEQAATFVMAHL